MDEALELPEVHAVVIATRHESHASLAARALGAGRDVFVEKPAALDEMQLSALGDAVNSSKARLLVGFNRRFSPFARRVSEAFSRRSAGLVMTARILAGRLPAGSWVTDAKVGGGRVVGEACHFVDLFSFWAGAPPVRVSAHAIGPDCGWDRGDNLVIALSFADGSVGNIAYSAMGDASVGKERYEVACEGTVAVIEDFRAMHVTSRGKTKTWRTLRGDKGHAAEMAAFVDACLHDRPSPIAWESIEATTRATFAIERAWREGALIDLSAS
jgi:predicted dehydrogenase